MQALANPAHRKHRRVLAAVEATAARNMRHAGSVRLVVPTAVRVEAGWDKRAPRAATVNRIRVTDSALDTDAANIAASVRTALKISVADAHIAAVLKVTAAPHAVLTSDTEDLRQITRHLGIAPNVVLV